MNHATLVSDAATPAKSNPLARPPSNACLLEIPGNLCFAPYHERAGIRSPLAACLRVPGGFPLRLPIARWDATAREQRQMVIL